MTLLNTKQALPESAADPSYRPVGTYEDILSIFARSEQRRYVRAGITAPKKHAVVRWIGEPILNACGVMITWLGELIGASGMVSIHNGIMRGLAGKATGSFNGEAPELLATRAMMEQVEQKTGAHPAVLCLMSHPPVLPESLGLNVEMARQAFLALHSLQPERGHHARLVIAVDAYALDMLDAIKGGLYAGFMGTYHLGLDRLIQHRRGPSRWLLNGTAWWRLPWRMSRFLAGSGRLGLVLSGGVPITARVLYTSREFLWQLRKNRAEDISPRDAVERLAKEEPEFAEFRRSDLVGPNLRRNAWRLMEAWIVARLSGQWPRDRRGTTDEDLEQGKLPDEQMHCLRACGISMGFSHERLNELLRDFREEYSKETPCRNRLFLFLLRRVLSRGRPIVLLPLSHHLDMLGASHAMKLVWGEPVALLPHAGKELKVCGGPALSEEIMPLQNFARKFVSANYT